MKSPTRRGLTILAPCALLLALPAACSSEPSETPFDQNPPATGPDDLPATTAADRCEPSEAELIGGRFDRDRVVLAPGQTRELELTLTSDYCVATKAPVAAANPGVATLDVGEFWFGWGRSRRVVRVTGGAVGETTVKVDLPRGDLPPAVLEVPVEVVAPTLPSCPSPGITTKLTDGSETRLGAASIGLQKGATKPNSGSFLWGVAPFDAKVECVAAPALPAGFLALGPAVRFSPDHVRLNRDIPFSVPVNPALMPEQARLRHVTVTYTGPGVASPRVVPIADPQLVKGPAGYELRFLAPRLGTYQAVVKADGGSVVTKRRLTYRALLGVSMGGSGTSMLGLRNHHLFDVVAPLGGPVEWTWLLGHLSRNHVGGFQTNDGETAPEEVAPMPVAKLPYEHPSTFNQWWYEFPKNGNGGGFDRSDYIQIFRDISLMFGNPGGYNQFPNGENLPAGVDPTHPSVIGDRQDRACAVWNDPIDEDANHAEQEALSRACPAARCRPENQLRLKGFYDGRYNPKAKWDVITFCDGAPQDSKLTPYANTWTPNGNDKPMELALAVDFNGNGLRDLNEPVVYQGSEPFEDVGLDGKPNEQEAGYAAGTNEDPAGDDWDPQYNPLGTEGNYRFDVGERYSDHGLDGVAGTKTSPYDFGEGNGAFDYTPGYRTVLARDSRSIISQYYVADPAKPFDQTAFGRLDVWTDGGLRDLFNSHVAAQALVGELSGRGRIVHYYSQFTALPGQSANASLAVKDTRWADLPGGVLLRYGKIDPTPEDIESGSGQHVGTGVEILDRLMVSFFYLSSRWENAQHLASFTTPNDPDPSASTCERTGRCAFDFTDSRGRKGPVVVMLPPGYAHRANVEHDVRYPSVYMLHGYGQTPSEFSPLATIMDNLMNNVMDATERRLPKSIMVFVDGRCRSNGSGQESECLRGNFYADSVRDKGPKLESWTLELMEHIDKTFRTKHEETVDWVE